MIEINLLPQELKKKKIKLNLEQFFKINVFLSALAVIVMLHIFFFVGTFINKKRFDRFNQTWSVLSPRKLEIAGIREELAEINKKVPLLEQLVSDRILWFEKLNSISDLIVPGVWLDEISLDTEGGKEFGTAQPGILKFIIIRGSAASRDKDEPALVGQFMQKLKDDHSFSADLSEIELGPIKKRQISQTEIMDFVLICQFKESKALTLLK